jgi:hypothetical protein
MTSVDLEKPNFFLPLVCRCLSDFNLSLDLRMSVSVLFVLLCLHSSGFLLR